MMKKIIKFKIFLILFFLINVQSFAQTSKVSLDVVPSSLKKEYFKKTGKNWDISSYSDRKIFWDNWLKEKKELLKERKMSVKDYEEYGEDYSVVPFDIRYLYERSNGKSWDEATDDEKKAYLAEYASRKKSLEKERIVESKRLMKEKRMREKEAMKEKRLEERRLKEQQRIEEAKRKAKEKRDREFQKKVEKQKKKLEKMRKLMKKLHDQ